MSEDEFMDKCGLILEGGRQTCRFEITAPSVFAVLRRDKSLRWGQIHRFTTLWDITNG